MIRDGHSLQFPISSREGRTERSSFNTATLEGFTARTGALGGYYELPFKALKYLLDEEIYARAAAMTDPGTMPGEERRILIGKLREIDPGIGADLEKEQVDRYETTINRIKAFDDAEFATKLEQAIEGLKPR